MPSTQTTREQVQIPLITSENVSRGKGNLNNQLINWYPVVDPDSQARYKTYWYPTPGLENYVLLRNTTELSGYNPSIATSRSAFRYKNYLFIAAANIVGRVDLTATDILASFEVVMTLNTYGIESYANEGGTVKFAAIENQLCAVDGSNYVYHYNLATDVFTATNMNTAMGRIVFVSSITSQDGYFIVNNEDTNEFFVSEVNDGTAWDPLANGFANTSGDPIKSIISYKAKLYFIGQQSTEVWFNAASSLTNTVDFIQPFEKVQGATIKYGTAAENSVVIAPNFIMFLSENTSGQREVIKLAEYTAEPVTTKHIINELNELSDITSGEAFVYQQEGSYIYQISFVEDNITFCCNLDENVWFKKNSYYNGGYKCHRAKWQVFANGINICGDRYTVNLLNMTPDVYTDLGERVYREGTSPVLSYNNKNFKLANLFIDCSTGEGIVDDLVNTPQLMVEFTEDGGRSYSFQSMESLGTTGAYKDKIVFGQLGTYKTWQVKLSITDNTFCAIYGITANVVIQDSYYL